MLVVQPVAHPSKKITKDVAAVTMSAIFPDFAQWSSG
jgi:hypothetical protein